MYHDLQESIFLKKQCLKRCLLDHTVHKWVLLSLPNGFGLWLEIGVIICFGNWLFGWKKVVLLSLCHNNLSIKRKTWFIFTQTDNGSNSLLPFNLFIYTNSIADWLIIVDIPDKYPEQRNKISMVQYKNTLLCTLRSGG